MALETKTPYFALGTPEASITTTLLMPGQLGKQWKDPVSGKTWQLVLMDTGATPTPASGLLVFWHDHQNYVVTTKLADSEAGQGAVCGVLKGAVLAGYYGWIQKNGPATVKIAATNTPAAGMWVTAGAGSDAAALAIGASTAPPHSPVGVCLTAIAGTYGTAAASGHAWVDLQLEEA